MQNKTTGLRTNLNGREGADVLSTRALLGLMENACIKASDPYLPADSTTVGIAVDDRERIVVTDVNRHRIQVYQKEAIPLTPEHITPPARSPVLQTT